jgi:copper chaperone NosL
MKQKIFYSICLMLSFFLVHCQKDQGKAVISLEAQAIHTHACAACGMIVREEPSPRGQVIHRDGKRVFFCSLSDMLTYLETPSPHGKARMIFVEGMNPKTDPLVFSPKTEPWLAASKATYVLGVKKTRVMGVPILSYEKKADAEIWAKQYKGQVVTWEALRPAWQKLRGRP